MRLMLLLVFVATPLYACCPVDKDSFADEVPHEKLLSELAGMIPRKPAAYWQARLDQLSGSAAPVFEQSLQRAECLDQLDRQPEGLNLLLALNIQDLSDTQAEALKLSRLQLAFDLWWRGGSDAYPPAECLRIATESLTGPHKSLMARILRWAGANESADPDRYLPDFFNLRYATNKTADHDTGELKNLGLANAADFLLEQMRRHPAWEKFDVLYALNLLYVVEGRQNLAYYARLRCWQMHSSGQHSRIQGAAEIADIKPLTILRQDRAGVLVAVKIVSDENQAVAEMQFKARSAYAKQWQLARSSFVDAHAADVLNSDFWAAFVPPAIVLPPLRSVASSEASTEPAAETAPPDPPAIEQAPDSDSKGSRTITWMTLGILAAILALGALAKSRLNRSDSMTEEKN